MIGAVGTASMEFTRSPALYQFGPSIYPGIVQARALVKQISYADFIDDSAVSVCLVDDQIQITGGVLFIHIQNMVNSAAKIRFADHIQERAADRGNP